MAPTTTTGTTTPVSYTHLDWLKTETAEQIQARMMESLPPDIDDTEGGFHWDFTYPTALEKDELLCSATRFLRNSDRIIEKK